MRKSRKFLSRAAIAAGVAAAAYSAAGAADLAPGFTRAAAPSAGERFSPTAMRDAAIALRAQWLARGHTVQQLAALAPPAITGGSVTASTITIGAAGAFPALSVSYSTDTPGLSSISVDFVSPNGKTAYGGSYATYYYTQTGTESFALVNPISLYSSPGKWSIADATIYDNAGNSTTYTASQLKALFTNLSYTVVNTGNVAKAPPRIITGQLLNTTVSLSAPLPLLKATISARDGSGPGIWEAYIIISPPDGSYSFYTFVPNAEPIKAGMIKANNVFGSGSPTGTWSIVGYGVCDYAFNCSGSDRDSDVVALLGTDTFTVTP